MTGYDVKIKECSQELDNRGKIAMKDTTEATKLDIATQNEDVIINVNGYCVLDIHNEKSDNKDYQNFVIIDKDGKKYVTGSKSFWSSFKGIFDEMSGEDFSIRVYRAESKNYAGKYFITCSIL